MNMNKHRAPISLWTMAAAILALGIAAAPAQQIPAGSYQKTCSNISVGGTTLNADCKTFNQQSIRTSLPYFASCVGDIGNINGTLACAGPNCLHREARLCERASGLGWIGSKRTTINEPRRSGEGLAMIGATECGPQLKPGTYDRKAPPTERS